MREPPARTKPPTQDACRHITCRALCAERECNCVICPARTSCREPSIVVTGAKIEIDLDAQDRRSGEANSDPIVAVFSDAAMLALTSNVSRCA